MSSEIFLLVTTLPLALCAMTCWRSLTQAATLPLLSATAPTAAAGLAGLAVRGGANQASVLLGDIQVSQESRAVGDTWSAA